MMMALPPYLTCQRCGQTHSVKSYTGAYGEMLLLCLDCYLDLAYHLKCLVDEVNANR